MKPNNPEKTFKAPSLWDYVRQENDRVRQNPTTAFGTEAWNRVRIVGELKENENLLRAAIVSFASFEDWNEEIAENRHDKATLEIGGFRVSFRIEYYDREMQRRTESPGMVYETRRVLCYGLEKDM